DLGAGADSEPAHGSAYREWDVRAYRLSDGAAGRTVSEFERGFAPARVFVERIRRGETTFAAAPDTRLGPGDVAAITARRSLFLPGGAWFGTEVEDATLLDFPTATRDAVIPRREVADRTLAEVDEEHGRGVALTALVRGGEEIPFGPATI